MLSCLLVPVQVSAAEPVYYLPSQKAVTILQGNNTDGSHQGLGAYAYDFVRGQEYFSVTAARAGTVIGLRNDSQIRCWDQDTRLTENGSKEYHRRCWAEANYVLVDHGDGISALYLHLEKETAKVTVGDKVIAGQELGKIGLTGWTTGPHLHFQVEKTPSASAQKNQSPGWWYTQSVPVTFNKETPPSPTQEAEPTETKSKKPKETEDETVTKDPSDPTSTSPGSKPSATPTPSPRPAPTDTRSPEPTPAPTKTQEPKPTPTPPPSGNVVKIEDFFTTDTSGNKKTSFKCGEAMHFRYILNNTYGEAITVNVQIWTHRRLVLDENPTLKPGLNHYYSPMKQPTDVASGQYSADLLVQYDGKTAGDNVAYTLTCA